MNTIVKSLTAMFSISLAIACSTLTQTNDAQFKAKSAQKAEYEQCLQDSQAVAMAWDAIERECRKNVGLAGAVLEPPE